MRASYELRIDDLNALRDHALSRTKRSKFVLIGPILLYVAVTAYAITNAPRNSIPVLLVPVVLIAITLIRAIRTQAPARATIRNNFCGHCELKIEHDGLTEIRASGEVKRNWSAIDRVVRTKQHLFIYSTGLIAFVLPKRAFINDDEFDRFVKAIEGRVTVTEA